MSDKPVKRLRRTYTTKCKLEQLEILEKRFSNNTGVLYFSQLNSKLRICLTLDEDWDHELWIQSQISAKTKPYPYSDLIEPSDFMQPFPESRKNKIQVKEIVDSHITDSIESVLSNLFE